LHFSHHRAYPALDLHEISNRFVLARERPDVFNRPLENLHNGVETMAAATKKSRTKSKSEHHAQANGRATKRAAASKPTAKGSKSGGGRAGKASYAGSNGAATKNKTRSKRSETSSKNGSAVNFLKKHGAHLSPSTKRAHWIEKPADRQQRDGQTLATRSHAVIQKWASERGGVPATVVTKKTTDRPRVLRIDFPGYSEGRLEEIGWKEWFGTFDKRDLVFLFQETTKDGKQSNFFRLDSPHREDG
jgi:hypothetical protein